jgi:hypothetical protein
MVIASQRLGTARSNRLQPRTTQLVALTGAMLGFDLYFYGEDEVAVPQ